MSWNPTYAFLLVVPICVDYYCALQISRQLNKTKRRLWLSASIFIGLGMLFFYKYTNFLIGSIFSTKEFSLDIILPVGISFYTFQSMSYTIDVYRGVVHPEKNIARFALFISFFPQLVAGPIERFNHLMPQIYAKHKLHIQNVLSGLRIMVWGFFKKIVIADRLTLYVDPVFNNNPEYSGISLLIAGFFFLIQLYCDFSGYYDIACGTARLFGYNLIENWKRPLLSSSVIEFWRRWHISLTSWFKDYVYIPLGGNRVSKVKWVLNILIVFIISGIWHGANWTFLIWGMMHGIVFILEYFTKKVLKITASGFSIFGWIYLLAFETIAFIAFRSSGVHDLYNIYSKIFSFQYSIENFISDFQMSRFFIFSFIINVALIAFLFFKELKDENSWLVDNPSYKKIWRPLFYIGLFISIFVLGEFNLKEFIYFQF